MQKKENAEKRECRKKRMQKKENAGKRDKIILM